LQYDQHQDDARARVQWFQRLAKNHLSHRWAGFPWPGAILCNLDKGDGDEGYGQGEKGIHAFLVYPPVEGGVSRRPQQEMEDHQHEEG